MELITAISCRGMHCHCAECSRTMSYKVQDHKPYIECINRECSLYRTRYTEPTCEMGLEYLVHNPLSEPVTARMRQVASTQ